MKNQNLLIIKNSYIKKYQSGYPLILKEAILKPKHAIEEGTKIVLVDEKNHFIGQGYYGIQNKGCGWVLTHNQEESMNEGFFIEKIKDAIIRREAFFNNEETTAFRIFNGVGDGIGGLTIDYLQGYVLINWYSKGIYAFKNEIIKGLDKHLRYKGIYEKKRFNVGGKYIEGDDFVKGEEAQFPIIVKEKGTNFAIYLNEGAMVGIFLDQREVRKAVQDKYAKGKSVLNTFSYTGAFSVSAALGGAQKTTSVDLAKRSLSKTKEQFTINHIDVAQQDIIVEDVFHYYKYAIRKSLKFDMVILDPPSFAKSKKLTFSVPKDYKNLMMNTIEITNKNGIILASTNYGGFNMKKFQQIIKEAFNECGVDYEILETYSLPDDFRTIKSFEEDNYLKVVFIRRK